MLNGIPVVAIDDPAAAARRIGEACAEIGFFAITAHGVDPAVIEAMQSTSRAFFALPMAEKRAAARPAKNQARGYTAFGEEALSYSLGEAAPPDIKEHYSIGPVDPPPMPVDDDPIAAACFTPNLWPARPPEFQAAWTGYYRAMEALSHRLLDLFARALALPEGFFGDKFDHHPSVLRANLYPEQTEAPLPGQLRAGAHTDYGILTVLLTDQAAGGLQVHTRAGQWIDAVSPPGGFIVNIGDLMMHWTNDRWVSTLHRVVNPPVDLAATARRLSVPFFCNANHDAEIACIPTCLAPGEQPKYPPVLAGEHRMAKFLKAATG